GDSVHRRRFGKPGAVRNRRETRPPEGRPRCRQIPASETSAPFWSERGSPLHQGRARNPPPLPALTTSGSEDGPARCLSGLPAGEGLPPPPKRQSALPAPWEKAARKREELAKLRLARVPGFPIPAQGREQAPSPRPVEGSSPPREEIVLPEIPRHGA